MNTVTQQAAEKDYLIVETFPSLEVKNPKATIRGLEDVNNPLVPAIDQDYVFNKDLVTDLRSLYLKPFSEGLCVFGHSGTGKTSGVLQYMARLNRPVRSISCSGRMTADDFIGFHALKSERPGEAPVMKFLYGPLPLAMIEGSCLLINEIDMVEPSELMALKDVLEGRPLIISSNGGEIIYPHPDFRIIVTSNTIGGGDETGLYQGARMQNLAFMDCFRFAEVHYLSQEHEIDILNKVVPTLPVQIKAGMVSVANGIRHLFMGDEYNGGTISVPLTTRVLIRWARLMQLYRGADRPLEISFQKAFLLKVNKAEKETITRVCKDVFGENWSNPITKFTP